MQTFYVNKHVQLFTFLFSKQTLHFLSFFSSWTKLCTQHSSISLSGFITCLCGLADTVIGKDDLSGACPTIDAGLTMFCCGARWAIPCTGLYSQCISDTDFKLSGTLSRWHLFVLPNSVSLEDLGTVFLTTFATVPHCISHLTHTISYCSRWCNGLVVVLQSHIVYRTFFFLFQQVFSCGGVNLPVHEKFRWRLSTLKWCCSVIKHGKMWITSTLCSSL